jgi:hypothetical protein
VTPRERWQALQEHLSRARKALEAGDRHGALQAIDAALVIDSEFLAAQTLRERILTIEAIGAPPPSIPLIPDPSPVTEVQVDPTTSPGLRVGAVSSDGLARFEARARQRRAARRMAAATEAIGKRRLADARQALDEIRELDPEHPDLEAREAELAAAALSSSRHVRAGRWLAAAAVFIAVVLGATWLETARIDDSLTAYPIAEIGTLVPDTGLGLGRPEVEPPDPIEVATTDDLAVTVKVLALEKPTTIAAVVTAARTVPEPASVLGPPVELAVAPVALPIGPPPVTAAASIAAIPVALPSAPASSAASASAGPDDEQLVQRTLQRYRNAYEALDARSAHAVWPGVNEPALERAFQGLESQTLSFNACDVELRGVGATAVCRGSARYVPKVGSRDPRVEPRVWNFTLRRAGADWQIENARVDR